MARCICIAYNGKWTKHNKYLDHETKLILINDDITFESLVEKIFQALKLKSGEAEAKIWFDTKLETSKGMLVTNDEEVTTCIYLLKNDSNFKTSRFIVDIVERKSLPANSSKTKQCNSVGHEEVNMIPQEEGAWEMHIEKEEALVIDDETFIVVEPNMQLEYPTTKDLTEESVQTSNEKIDGALVAEETIVVVEPTTQPEHPTTKEITQETGQTSNGKKDGAAIAADEAFEVVEPTVEPDPTTKETSEETGQTSNGKKDEAVIAADEALKVVEPTVEPEYPTTNEITDETRQTSNEKKDEALKVVVPTSELEFPTTKEISEETGQTSNEMKDEAFKVFEPTFDLESPTTKGLTEGTGQTSNVMKVRKRPIIKRENSPALVLREDAYLDETVVGSKRRRSIIKRDDSPTVVLREDASLDEVVVGSIFEDKESLKKCFSNNAIKEQFKFKVDKTGKRQYYLKCYDDECNWHVHSSRIRDSSLYRITQFERNHSCALDVSSEEPQVTSEEVSEYIVEFLRDTKAEIKPKFVVDEMKKTYGVNISYHKAWRAIQLALGMIRGSAQKNPELCPSCLHKSDDDSSPES